MADNTVDLVALAEGLVAKAKAGQLTQGECQTLLAMAPESGGGDDGGDPPKGDVKERAAAVIAARFGQTPAAS